LGGKLNTADPQRARSHAESGNGTTTVSGNALPCPVCDKVKPSDNFDEVLATVRLYTRLFVIPVSVLTTG